MAKGSDYFSSLDDNSKQRYKVKINNIQGNDPYQIKKKNFLSILVNFHRFSGIAYYSSFIFIFIESTDYESFKSSLTLFLTIEGKR